jgi:ubiquitin
MPTTIEDFKKAFKQAAAPTTDLAKQFAVRRASLSDELTKLEKSPNSRQFGIDLGHARNSLDWANDAAQKGKPEEATENLDKVEQVLSQMRQKDLMLFEEEKTWLASRGRLIDAMVAADQSHTLLVEAFGASIKDEAKERVKAIQSLNANLAGADKLVKTDRKSAIKMAEKFIAEADALVKTMQPEAEKLYQKRRKPVAKAIEDLAKHPQKNLLADEIKSAETNLKAADGLAKTGQYKFALDKLKAADDIASSANACDLSKEDKKAVFEELKKKGDPGKALAVAAITNAKGTATKEDAVVVAEEAAKLPTEVLRRLNAKGATLVAARGNVPDVIPSLKGVQPNGWPPNLKWDNVPGVYQSSSKQIVACTRDDGGKRKVLETGKEITVDGKKVSHGSFSVVLHEAGHGLDFNGYHDGKEEISAELSSKTLFTSKRDKDVTANKIVSPRDDYYLQNSPWGERETFAESTARHFGGDGKFSGDWPDTAKFWQAKPWGIGAL